MCVCVIRLAPPLMMAGVVFFSGSLYLLVLTQKRVKPYTQSPRTPNPENSKPETRKIDPPPCPSDKAACFLYGVEGLGRRI